MPPFPERESSILAILKKKKPGRVPEGGAVEGAVVKERKSPALNSVANNSSHNTSNQSADLLGLSSPLATTAPVTQISAPLVDVLQDVFNGASPPTVNNGFGTSFQAIDNLKKYPSFFCFFLCLIITVLAYL